MRRMTYTVLSFYKFTPLSVDEAQTWLTRFDDLQRQFRFRGLVLLGKEGINGTISGSQDLMEKMKRLLQEVPPFLNLKDEDFKWSKSDFQPFLKFKIKIKEEIVTLGRPDLVPQSENNFHLTPEQWHETLQKEDVVLIDTRNDYEFEMGTFKGSINPHTREFNAFPEFIKNSNLPKDKKILIFCTGGIRCEKAILEFQEQGYDNVYQLKGGILKYLEKFPNQEFTGECFIFDDRVAVDQHLNPTSVYRLCPHCGDPSKNKINCVRCDSEAFICDKCYPNELFKITCSKNCAHHYKLNPHVKGKPQPRPLRRQPANKNSRVAVTESI